jgi:uncharacterized protein (DUF983 family)
MVTDIIGWVLRIGYRHCWLSVENWLPTLLVECWEVVTDIVGWVLRIGYRHCWLSAANWLPKLLVQCCELVTDIVGWALRIGYRNCWLSVANWLPTLLVECCELITDIVGWMLRIDYRQCTQWTVLSVQYYCVNVGLAKGDTLKAALYVKVWPCIFHVHWQICVIFWTGNQHKMLSNSWQFRENRRRKFPTFHAGVNKEVWHFGNKERPRRMCVQRPGVHHLQPFLYFPPFGFALRRVTSMWRQTDPIWDRTVSVDAMEGWQLLYFI